MIVNTIRNGQKVWPTCPECGCRLEIFENTMFVTMRHFWAGSIKDARGCICTLVNMEWNSQKKDITHLGFC